MERMRVGMIEGRHPMPVARWLLSADEAAALSIWDMARLAAGRALALAGPGRRVEVFGTGLGPVLEAVVAALTEAEVLARQASAPHGGHAIFHFDSFTRRYRTVSGEWAANVPDAVPAP
jgi:hypothetical protein